MKPVRLLRTMRVSIPAMLLLITAVTTACGLWQAVNHRRTLMSFETCLRKAPRRDELTQGLFQLLRVLQDDNVPRPDSSEEYLKDAEAQRLRFDTTLQSVRQSIDAQRQRWQEFMTDKLRNPMDARGLFNSLAGKLHKMTETRALVSTDESWRNATINSFRQDLFELIDQVQSSQDPSVRMAGQYQNAAERVRLSFQVTGLVGLSCVLICMWFYRALQTSLWRPLGLLRRSLRAVERQDYQHAFLTTGAFEFTQMFESLGAIRERCECGEKDKDREVEDRCNQKVRSERLAGIGLLATGVAHEINNPLGAIVGAADGLSYRVADLAASAPPADAEIIREYLAMIQSESKRCRAITTKLLDFAKGRDGERALYDLTAIVHEVVGMFRHVRQYQSRTINISRHDPCRAFCNGPEIKQVVLNLVANALQATPDDGRLDIRINPSQDTVELVFQDTGSGMSPETLEHLFDPFFSTKGPGQGTGLGLSISHAIIEKHHGTLEAASAGQGQGSTFRLRLPTSETAAQAAAERKAA